MNLVGFRTIIVGLLMAIGVPALSYFLTIDWVSLGVSPTVAFMISGAITIAMRALSRTPITKHNAVSAVAAMPDQELRQAGVVKILTSSNPIGEALALLTPGNVVSQADQYSSLAQRRG